MGSLIFYLLLTGVLMYLCKGTSDSVNRKRSIFVAYTIFFVVAAIRYGIGNDYAGYAPSCIFTARYFSMGASLRQGLMAFSEDVEMAHIFFSWLVQWMEYPFVGLYFIYSFLQVGLLYLILNRNDEHYWGLFIFIIGEFMFCSWDAIRQFTAVLIIVYSYDFIKRNDVKSILKFIACVGAAWLFHHSAIFMFPAYLLKFLKVNRWVLIGFLGVVTAMSVSGVLQQYQEQVGLYFDYLEGYEYSTYGSNAAFTVVAESFQYRMRLLFVGVFYMLILYYYPKGNPLYEILLTIGVSIFIFANNGLTLMRISWYFWMVAVLMVGPSFKEMRKQNVAWLRTVFIVGLLAVFSHDVITGSNSRGCSEYSTIITGDLDHLPQRD